MCRCNRAAPSPLHRCSIVLVRVVASLRALVSLRTMQQVVVDKRMTPLTRLTRSLRFRRDTMSPTIHLVQCTHWLLRGLRCVQRWRARLVKNPPNPFLAFQHVQVANQSWATSTYLGTISSH
ncbi:hypothetical protein HDV57DRAFT_489680 [Trichoderma longibrachiatum]